MIEQHREIIELAVFDLESKSGVRWGPEYMEEFAAALRALLAENAALKAKDPLAEMWRELEAYQPQANADGHGESWRIMCKERTEDAAEIAQDIARVGSISSGLTAPWVAAMCARWAVAWREHSEQNTQQAIALIRRAKEVKP
jgi:hypothetical protein